MGKYDAYAIVSWELSWYICILLIGSFGNISVLIVGAKSKNIVRSNPFNVYVTSLALIDLLISLLVVPMYVVSTELIIREIMYFFAFWFVHMSMYLLVAISLERHNAIMHPFSTLRKRPFKMTMLIVSCTALMGFLNEVPYIYGLIHPKQKYWKLTLHAISSACEILIPMIIFIVSFVQIKQCLDKRERNLEEFLHNKTEKECRKSKVSKQTQAKKATINTIKLVILTFFLCTLPNEIFYIILQYGHVTALEWGSPLYQIAILLRFTTSCLNPLLYSCRSREFRRNFKQVFKPPVSCSIEMGRLRTIRNTSFDYSRLSSSDTQESISRNRLL